MKIHSPVIFLSSALCLLLSACAGLPAAGSASQPSASQTAPVVNNTPDEPTPAENASTETTAVDESQTVPETGDAIPAPPPGDKLLYFYPEPETVPAIPAPAAPLKTEPPKPAIVKTEPPKPAPAKTEQTKPAPAKTEPVKTGTAEKEKEPVMPGIWESEPVSPSVAAQPAPLPPSRTADLAVGQTLEVWYPGSGWVFLGDASAQNGLGYQTRKLDKTDTLFMFKALKPGNYILNFSRFDVLQDAFAADSLAVTVTDTTLKNQEKVRAPDYRAAAIIQDAGKIGAPVAGNQSGTPVGTPSGSPAGIGPSSGTTAPEYINPLTGTGGRATTKSTGTGSSAPATGGTMSDEPGLLSAVSSSAPSAPPPTAGLDAETILTQAKAALSSGDTVKALDLLNSFFGLAVNSLDEGWFVRGQAYEANGPARDIRKALAAYETLVSAYPDSSRWKEADGRIRYIERFYLNIR